MTPGEAGPRGESAGAGPRLSITDFLTDGSLASLCAELTRLVGVSVNLFDVRGRLVAPGERPGTWSVRETEAEPDPARAVPLTVSGERIGWLVIGGGEPRLDPGQARAALERVIALLASTASELCEEEMELRHRIKEVSALYRLTSMLARAADIGRVLEVVLDSALDVLELDAGSVVLMPDDADGIAGSTEEDLALMTSRGLSRDWLESPLPLSRDRLFDRLALGGEIVTVDDLRGDERVLIGDRAEREGLRAFINAGLVFHNKPIGVIRLYSRTPRRFGEAEKGLLRSFAQQAAVAVEQARLLRFQQEEQRIQRQLELAADVQRRMLPNAMPKVTGLDIAAKYTPSFELGGDFYDFIELNGHLGLAVGDVVGKGIAAALLMSSVRASLRAHAEETYDLDEIVGKVNVALCRDTLDREFASLWYGVIDPHALLLTYCSAGHEPTYVVRHHPGRAPTEKDIEELGVGGMVVGINPAEKYQRAVCKLNPGDVIVAYTDGVGDAQNFSNEKFTRARLRATLLKALGQQPGATAAQVLEAIQWELRQFVGLRDRTDDQTVAVVRVRPR